MNIKCRKCLTCILHFLPIVVNHACNYMTSAHFAKMVGTSMMNTALLNAFKSGSHFSLNERGGGGGCHKQVTLRHTFIAGHTKLKDF